MASTSSSAGRKVTSSKDLGHVLVTGGCGGLGTQIINLLLERKACSKLSAMDLRPSSEPINGCEYHFGDLTNEGAMRELFIKIKPTIVIHTASPKFNMADEILYKVNVDGTKTLLRVASETGVKAFVYTSSASVISDNSTDLINADETYPLVTGKAQPEYYTNTKMQALAEQAVLEYNRPASNPRFLTCALRPSGIFGVGDQTLLPPMLAPYYKGQTKFQLGENINLFDFTESTNVAHAHHLAAAALLTTAEREEQGQISPLDHEKVDGEAFFITNDSPMYFWDFTRTAWRNLGDTTAPNQIWTINKDFGLFIATLFEWIFWIFQLGVPNLTRQKVKFSCMTRYYSIEKAKRRLGYRPVVGVTEGLKRGVADCVRRGVIPGSPEEAQRLGSESKKAQ
ncbi:hypothetical protein D6C98_08592 [Aureobasidium pullulans]|uniref:Sterol-4-alpha-carboxylate 3-dehydrogenase ERG26, decarboxylating n=1 Tax=Aureobasidium pullulans TaxID=5580 RepID=A0A4S8VEF6_AURPU|nr:hypothetical protein D6D24_08312 [Aureobasidium pullulans]THY43385.1 hypothetical protein D6C98_08592 [Aureobasidium pullulans]THZ16067.1 hypothetical protein D6C89_09432 [Aureobasidium pullulans]